MSKVKKVIINGKVVNYTPNFCSHEIPFTTKARLNKAQGTRPIQIKKVGDEYEVTTRNRENQKVTFKGKLNQVVPSEFRYLASGLEEYNQLHQV